MKMNQLLVSAVKMEALWKVNRTIVAKLSPIGCKYSQKGKLKHILVGIHT